MSGAPERAWKNPTDRYSTSEFSEKFQWLPTDVDVSDDCDVAFRSYVTNVHPEVHRELASVLPDVFARFRPLLENVLTDLRHPRPLRIAADPYGWYDSEPVYPDKPEYPGGSWHVEGMLNERIVSTDIYYWDSENITESRLSFRVALDAPHYEQNDDKRSA